MSPQAGGGKLKHAPPMPLVAHALLRSIRACATAAAATMSLLVALVRGRFLFFGRQLYDGEPEVLDGLHHLHELPQVHRLFDVAVDVQPVGFENVFFPGGQRQYYDGYPLEVVIGLDLRQHLAAILLRQVEVEQDQIGPRRRCKLAFPPEVGYGFDPIPGDAQIVPQPVRAERLPGQAHIGRVVLYEEDFHRSTLHCSSFLVRQAPPTPCFNSSCGNPKAGMEKLNFPPPSHPGLASGEPHIQHQAAGRAVARAGQKLLGCGECLDAQTDRSRLLTASRTHASSSTTKTVGRPSWLTEVPTDFMTGSLAPPAG